MKILIVANSNNNELDIIENCKSRNDFFSFMIIKFSNEFPNIQFFFRKYLMDHQIKNQQMNSFPNVDHVIFIDEIGLYKKSKYLMDHIRSCSNNTVSTLCKSWKFFNGEDIMFSFTNSKPNDKFIYIKPSLDDSIYLPDKQEDSFYILFNKSDIVSNTESLNKNSYLYLKIKKLITNYDVKLQLAFINTNSIDFVDENFKIIDSKFFNNYLEYVDELKRSNIYCLLNTPNDLYSLYELSMCNTTIISQTSFINSIIQKELNIFVFQDKFKWNDVFDFMNNNDVRNFLVNNDYSWRNAISQIINRLDYFQLNSVNKENQNKKEKKNIKYILNINNKNKPTVLNIKNNDENKIPNNLKNKILLQSQILNTN